MASKKPGKIRTLIYIGILALFTVGTSISLSLNNAAPLLSPSVLEMEPIPVPLSDTRLNVELVRDSVMGALSRQGKIQLRPYELPLVPDSLIDSETLWLARCIYSETKRPEEQELIAWVVRNRVEGAYRGRQTYEHVVLDPYQFSAFNDDAPSAAYYSNLDLHHADERWKRAISIAHYVRYAKPDYRPFSLETLHFFSEQSMRGRRAPVWARGLTPIVPPQHYELDERRFRFYEGIS